MAPTFNDRSWAALFADGVTVTTPTLAGGNGRNTCAGDRAVVIRSCGLVSAAASTTIRLMLLLSLGAAEVDPRTRAGDINNLPATKNRLDVPVPNTPLSICESAVALRPRRWKYFRVS